MSCWEIMVNRYVDKKAMWFNSMQVKCAWFNSMQVKCTWEHGPCANVCILDHDVTKYKTEYDLVKVPTWNFPQNLDRETTVKKPVNGREKIMKSHQKLAPNVYSFFEICCSLFTGFSLKSLEPLVISSSLGTYRLEIGWWAAVVAEAVECLWGLVGFPLYMSTYIPRWPRST